MSGLLFEAESLTSAKAAASSGGAQAATISRDAESFGSFRYTWFVMNGRSDRPVCREGGHPVQRTLGACDCDQCHTGTTVTPSKGGGEYRYPFNGETLFRFRAHLPVSCIPLRLGGFARLFQSPRDGKDRISTPPRRTNRECLVEMSLWRNVPLEDGEEIVKRGSVRAEGVLDERCWTCLA